MIYIDSGFVTSIRAKEVIEVFAPSGSPAANPRRKKFGLAVSQTNCRRSRTQINKMSTQTPHRCKWIDVRRWGSYYRLADH